MIVNDFCIYKDLDDIGNFKSDGVLHCFHKRYSSLFVGFKPEKIKYNHKNKELEAQEFNSGYIDNENTFYPAPLKIGYVLIDSYIMYEFQNYSAFYEVLIFDFMLYSKDFKNKRKFHFQFQNNPPIVLKKNIFEITINYLNLYVENGYDINKIDAEKLAKDDFSLLSPKFLINTINSVEFEFTDYGANRVGRDNYFWTDTEIKNLTDDVYLKKLILENINIDKKSYYSYSPDESPHSYIDEKESNRLKTDLIVSILPKFNPMEQFFLRIQEVDKNNKSIS